MTLENDTTLRCITCKYCNGFDLDGKTIECYEGCNNYEKYEARDKKRRYRNMTNTEINSQEKVKKRRGQEDIGLAYRLRKIMELRSVTQSELATSIGVTRQAVSLYATGKNVPNATVLAKIAKRLNVSTDWLCGMSEKNSNVISIKTDKIIIQDETLARFIHDENIKLELIAITMGGEFENSNIYVNAVLRKQKGDC